MHAYYTKGIETKKKKAWQRRKKKVQSVYPGQSLLKIYSTKNP